jgi:hypothetical protein
MMRAVSEAFESSSMTSLLISAVSLTLRNPGGRALTTVHAQRLANLIALLERASGAATYEPLSTCFGID